MSDAKAFLEELSASPLRSSSLYLTEPVGPSKRYFLNAVVELTTDREPKDLIARFKTFEREHGRSGSDPRWSARTIDLDIISWGDLVVHSETLIIPHAEYRTRPFVLEPLHEIRPGWEDPETGTAIEELLRLSPKLSTKKLNLNW